MAATALTVKSALAGPVGPVAKVPLDEVTNGLTGAKLAALSGSSRIVDQATMSLTEVVTHASPGATTGASISARRPVRQPAATGTASDSSPRGQIDPAAPARADRTYSRALVKRILHEAAVRHGIDPKLVLALSYWESGWDQSRVSATGAVGLMQVEPDSARDAGPALLGRNVDITDAYDNTDVGAAILREDLDHFKDPAMALAAYYQGPNSLQQNGMLPDTQQYVQGILDLASRISD